MQVYYRIITELPGDLQSHVADSTSSAWVQRMNLEYDDEEQSLLSQFEEIAADIGAVRLRQQSGLDDGWSRLVNAGWSDLGGEIERGTLPLGLAVGVFRCAGRQLLVEQFLSSAYLLAALAAH